MGLIKLDPGKGWNDKYEDSNAKNDDNETTDADKWELGFYSAFIGDEEMTNVL